MSPMHWSRPADPAVPFVPFGLEGVPLFLVGQKTVPAISRDGLGRRAVHCFVSFVDTSGGSFRGCA